MKHLIILTLAIILLSFKSVNPNWKTLNCDSYIMHYTKADESNIKEYRDLIDKGIVATGKFFAASYKKRFDVYIYPDRLSIDSAWKKDWGMPDFKSECWMVASGVASKVDIISPKTWGNNSCEHRYADKIKTQQLVTHELVHVFHAQVNPSPDFSKTDHIDFFVEGLATYASGQCDAQRIANVKKAIAEERHPSSLDNFWKGDLKYGLSGTMVMYIDKKFGRKKLQELMKQTSKDQMLKTLQTTEGDLIAGWAEFTEKL